MLFCEINSQRCVREKKRERGGGRGVGGRVKRAHFPPRQCIHTHTLRRIYGRLRAAVDKIICLFDLLFNSRGRVLFVRAHL